MIFLRFQSVMAGDDPEFADPVDIFDTVRDYIQGSRYLAAKRLLDDVTDKATIPTDIPIDEVDLVYSQMNTIVGLSDTADRWTFIKSEGGVDTYFCRPDGDSSSKLSVKVEAAIDVSVMTCMSLIHEVDLFPNWIMKNAMGMVKLTAANSRGD
jgi:hypothetical protein